MKLAKDALCDRTPVWFLVCLALAWCVHAPTAHTAEDAHPAGCECCPAEGANKHAAHAADEKHGEHADEEHAEDAHGDHRDRAHEAEEAHTDADEHAGHDDADDEHGDHEGHAHEAETHEDADVHAGDHGDADDHGDHEGHADAAEEHDDADEHAGHDHAEHADEEGGLRLTAEQRKRFGIVVNTAGPGALRNEVSLPGEIVFNEDRVVHLVPRAPGIAVEVYKTLGDVVEAGEALALIDSVELGSAKLDYVAAVTEVGCCQFELPRAQAIHDNVLKLLELLNESPSVEHLREAAPGEMGDYGSRLISAYAEYVNTQKAYERERTLVAKKISSEGDFLAAESAFRKAQAEYYGARDSVAFEVRQNLLETTRDRQLAEFEVETARQKLHLLGLSESAVATLGPTLVPSAGTAEPSEHVCTDPNCTNCAAGKASATPQGGVGPQVKLQNLGRYEIKAPFGGVIVQKHIALGERVGEDADTFTIVDTDTVWANLTVYTKDLAVVRKGQEVVLRAAHSGAQARGAVAMVTPFVDEATRSATARVVLDNSDGRWVPGTFVTGFIGASQRDVPVVVAREAVQSIDGRDVVFTEHEGRFEATPVMLGRTDRASVEIVAGLEPGTPYVTQGAFQLKATVVTSNLDSHAGHGH